MLKKVRRRSATRAVLRATRISPGFKRWSWQNYRAVTTGGPCWNHWPAWERCSREKSRRLTHPEQLEGKKKKAHDIRRDAVRETRTRFLFLRDAPSAATKTALIQKICITCLAYSRGVGGRYDLVLFTLKKKKQMERSGRNVGVGTKAEYK